MKKSQPPNQFEMETLEPRVLLSGESAAAMAYASLPDELNPCGEVGAIPNLEEVPAPSEVGAPNPVYQQSLQYELSPNQTDIFAGIDAVELDYEQQPLSMEVEADSLAATSGDIKAAEDAAPSERLITETEQLAIATGLEGLSNLAGVLEDFDAFGTPIPLTAGATLGQLLRPKEILDTRLFKAVYDYFSDATDPPTLEGLVAILEGGADQTGAVGRINSLNVGYYNSIDEIGVNVALEVALNGEVRLNADGLAEQVRFQFSEGKTATYTASIKFDFTFGIEQKDGSAVFFAEVRKLTADLSIDKVFLQDEAGADAGQTTLRIVSGKVDLNLKLDVNFDEVIAGNKRITLTDLQGITPETIGDLLHLTTSGVFVADLRLAPSQRFDNSAGVVAFLNVKSEDIFSGAAPEVSLSFNISSLRNSILELLKGIDGIGERLVDSSSQAVAEPFLGNSLNKIFSADHDSASSPFTKLYDPALDYFTLLDVFNFSIDENASAIGELPGIDTANFDINIGSHRLALKNLLENSFNLSLKADWDVSLYLPEIWSLLNPGFQINDYLPTFQALLGLPYLPRFDEIRSETKSRFGTFPSLNGLLEYLRMAGKRGTVSRSAEQPVVEPFVLKGEYSPEQDDLRFDFSFDSVQQSDVAVDLAALFSEQFQDAGLSLSSDVIVAVSAEARLNLFASVSSDAVSLTKREASVTIRVNQEINGLGLTVEGLADSGMIVSEGRFAFDARTEIVAHGHDPPVLSLGSLSDFRLDALADNGFDTRTSGTFSLTLPVASENSSHPILIIYVTSEELLDPSRVDLTIDDQRTITLTPDKPLTVDGTLVIAADQTLNGSGQVMGEVVNYGLLSPGNSPGVESFAALTLDGSSSTLIEIAGTGDPGTAYDQIRVTNLAQLGGTLNIALLNGFVPTAGQTFDIITFGSVSGTFADATGLFGFGDNSLYFEIVNLTDRIQLQVKQVSSGGVKIQDSTVEESNSLGKAFGSYFAGFNANVSVKFDISGFVSVSGDIGVARAGSQIKVVAQSASAILQTGSFSAGVLSGSLALLLNDNGARIVYASGSFALSGGDFVNASGTVTVRENTTGSLFAAQSVTVGAVTVVVPELAVGLKSVSGVGLTFDVTGFVSLSGDLGFEKTGTAIIAVGGTVTASLTVGTSSVSLSAADFGLKVDGAAIAFELKNGTIGASLPGISVSGGNVLVQYTSSTGSASSAETLSVGGLSYTFDAAILSSTIAFTVTGFNASVADFVSLSGNLGFKKTGTEIIAVGSGVTASLTAGTAVNVTLSNANFGLKAGDCTTAFELKDGEFAASISGLADITATGVLVRYTNAATSVTAGTVLTVGSTSYTFASPIAASTIAMEVTGFKANIADFVSLSGNLGFKKTGTEIIAVGSGVTASLTAGTVVNVTLSNANFGLKAGDGTTAFELKDGEFAASISGLADITAT
ncbi:MAG: LEPR-XLL domain-containing protein, partial [Syntrophales bacterium]